MFSIFLSFNRATAYAETLNNLAKKAKDHHFQLKVRRQKQDALEASRDSPKK